MTGWLPAIPACCPVPPGCRRWPPGGAAVRKLIAARLHLVPRFRQRLHVPRPGLGRPLWVDAPAFDLADHVRVLPLPDPGNEAALLRAAGQLRRLRLVGRGRTAALCR